MERADKRCYSPTILKIFMEEKEKENMNKNEFAKALQGKVEGLTKKDALILIDSISEVISDALVNGEDVKLPGLGAFKTNQVEERTMTLAFGESKGKQVVIPAHKSVSFKTSSILKEKLK